ncbi:Kunitz family trypsin and protease inhibitor protein [Striga hermonthica]|uniref:Kunitz family trypsin and protease inhibitor protein n=1 Tax=Striga hermonthica TaxID=68872 RepID=A0A9N7RAP4_STRHE|nr:Kunitz family trypsin and protease inhibitor protein [Striga hermonthica]
MKKAHLLLTFTLFSIWKLCPASEQPSPVLDIRGNVVRAGVDYYILPVIRGMGGGLTVGSTGNRTCPFNVVQEQLEVDDGLPLTFHPVDPKRGVVRVSTDHNIEFSGGLKGNPGRETVSNWFKIEEYEGDYKLVFCPTVCNYCKVVCKDVGVFVEDGQRVLALTDNAPFRVMFKKA